MSLTYSEMLALCGEIKTLLKGLKITDIKESPSLHYILTFDEHAFLVCMQAPFLRFHLLKQNPNDNTSDHFATQLRHYLIGSVFDDMSLLNDDRILRLTFKKKDKAYHLIAEMFPKGANAYLLDCENSILASLKQYSGKTYHPPKILHPHQHNTAAHVTSDSIAEKYRLLEQQYLFDTEKKTLERELNARLMRAQKFRQKCKQNLIDCLEWEKIHHEGLLLQSNLFKMKKGMSNIDVQDWENEGKEKVIQLDPTLTPQQEIAKRFKASKKLKAGIKHFQAMIPQIEEEIRHLETHVKQLDNCESLDQLERFRRQEGHSPKKSKKESAEEKKALPYREFETAAGLKIWVGKNARCNEDLTFRHARGSDWWLHARDYPGSHVVLKVKKQGEPDAESLHDAMQLAMHFSKANKLQETEISITQCKYVSRLGKGRMGQVQISNSRISKTENDPERLARLKRGKSSEA